MCEGSLVVERFPFARKVCAVFNWGIYVELCVIIAPLQ